MKWYRVEVSDHDGPIVAIEPGMLAGRDIGVNEAITIREAIESLHAFVGPERPRCSDGNRYCLCADPENCTEAVPNYICKAGKSCSAPSDPPASNRGAEHE